MFHSADDTLVASTDGLLSRGSPVRLEFAVPADVGRVQLRATVMLTGPSDQGSTAMAVLEDWDPLSVTIGQIIVCGPPSGRDGAATYCPGWHVSNMTTGS